MWFQLPKLRSGLLGLFTGFLLTPMMVLAAASDATQKPVVSATLPYEIQADSAVFDQLKGTGSYQGHVQLKRGAEQLKAKKLTLQLDANKQLSRVQATGNPVTFTDGAGMQGRAGQLLYDVKNHSIRLIGNAFVTQGERQFSGAEIDYALDTKRVQAKGGDGNRVKLVLPPSDTLKSDKQEAGK